jgi:hypothetical protein
MTNTMENLVRYLQLEQMLQDLKQDLGEELMLEYLALAIEQVCKPQPVLRVVR